MSVINSHVILSYIDTPSRILIWQADQVLVCVLPFFLGMITEHIIVGIVFSFVFAFLFKIFQKKFGKGKIRAILYWYFPTDLKLIKKGLPPSHVRSWIK